MNPIIPPFTAQTALQKVKAVQDLWNTQDPARVAFGYTHDTIWRNRDTFLNGRDQVIEFLTKRWKKENGYRLRKELFAFTDNRIAVQVTFMNQSHRHRLRRAVQLFYEWYEEKADGSRQWYRTYGLEVGRTTRKGSTGSAK